MYPIVFVIVTYSVKFQLENGSGGVDYVNLLNDSHLDVSVF